MKIKKVAIFGGNGTLGSLIAGIFASFGDAIIYLIVRDKEKCSNLFDKIEASIRSNVIRENLILLEYDKIQDELKDCDIIFESVAEDYILKEKIFSLINKYANNYAIIATGTSGLSINKLSKLLDIEKRKNFVGCHFFNPPYNMLLCEIIKCDNSNEEKIDDFVSYLERVLNRTIVYSKDEPAFIGNRIGFKLLNDMLIYAEKYKEKGGIEYIDNIISGYTGRAMKPLETIDFVGLDVHKAIVDNIYSNTADSFKESFKLPQFVNDLINENKLGVKSQIGLYKKNKNENNTNIQVLDLCTMEYKNKNEYNNLEIKKINTYIKMGNYEKAYKIIVETKDEDVKFVQRILVNYIVYSLIVSKDIGNNMQACDDAMATGFNWCPPIAMKDLFEKITDFYNLCEKNIDREILEKYDIKNLLRSIKKSKYDYRKFIKSI